LEEALGGLSGGRMAASPSSTARLKPAGDESANSTGDQSWRTSARAGSAPGVIYDTVGAGGRAAGGSGLATDNQTAQAPGQTRANRIATSQVSRGLAKKSLCRNHCRQFIVFLCQI